MAESHSKNRPKMAQMPNTAIQSLGGTVSERYSRLSEANKSLLLVDVPASNVNNINSLTGYHQRRHINAYPSVNSESTSYWHLQRLVTRNHQEQSSIVWTGDGVRTFT